MELRINVGLIKGLGDIDEFAILVNRQMSYKVRKKLESEKSKAISILRELKASGKIKSISKPRNSKLQVAIDRTMSFKSELDSSIDKIKELFN